MIETNTSNIASTKADLKEFKAVLSELVKKPDCEKQSERCRNALCTKIQEVKAGVLEVKNLVIELHNEQSKKVESLDQRREEAKDSYAKDFQKIIAFMARVESALKNERFRTENRE